MLNTQQLSEHSISHRMKNQTNMSSSATQDDDKANITSIRIVSVDHYMRYPVAGLDPCYSDFRAAEVKQVSPIDDERSGIFQT